MARMLRCGMVRARVVLTGIGFADVGLLYFLAFTTTGLALAAPLIGVGATLAALARGPSYAAMMDVVGSSLRSQASAVTNVLMTCGAVGALITGGPSTLFANLRPAVLAVSPFFLLGAQLIMVACRTYVSDVPWWITGAEVGPRRRSVALWRPDAVPHRATVGSLTDHTPRPAKDNLDFPAGFVWGVATAAHQNEGGNTNNDWWDWEHDPRSGCPASSGDACDSFHRWAEDVDLVADLGLGAYRFSLEWSRIEPAEDEWSLGALEHYRRMCARCHEKAVEPVVTFHHFTTPRWLAARGGWEAPDAPERFARFVERATRHLGDVIGRACTINEPNVVAALGYSVGIYPPGFKNELGRHLKVNQAMVRAHRLAVDAMRSGPGAFPIGLTLSMEEMVAAPGGEVVRDAAEQIIENTFLEATTGDDFIGVQCYERRVFGPSGELPPEPGARLDQIGRQYWPQVVEFTVRRAAKVTGIPVVVTENGLNTLDDAERVEFLSEALRGLHRCIADGIDIRGYFVWTLLDNYAFHRGYNANPGLFSVDRRTFERRAKPSAAWYGSVARTNALVPADSAE